ncbi:MAG: hypothetical protein ABIG32_00220 [Candidatus Uhrbacteria bacterium]|nr:hypothetical protein [Patescibacteria group bacterium]MBU1906824.1 hypothetical protein [Patescibacteria group bacterium]
MALRKVISHAHKLRFAMRDLFRNSPLYRWLTLLSGLLVIATFVLPIWKLIPNLDGANFIPLHYNIYFGVDRFGPWYYIFMMPALGLLLLIINIIFEGIYVKREHILSIFFAVCTVAVEALLFGSMILIVLLNL